MARRARAKATADVTALAPNDAQIALADGRRLGVAQWGDPGGTPVFDFHGSPASRLQGRYLDEAARAAGVRVVSVDRPGIGLSDRRRGYRIPDWPGDVAALADALGLDRFGVLGWSGGGPYALACAALLPARVRLAVTVAGVGRLDTKEGVATLSRADRALHETCLRAPWLARLGLALARRQDPDRARRRFRAEVAPPDRVVVDRLAAEGIDVMALFTEALRQGGAGVVDDYRAGARPWGFEPEDITVPVVLWHGTEDTSVPIAVSRDLAGRIPGAVLHEVPGAAHMLYIDRAADIVRDFVSR